MKTGPDKGFTLVELMVSVAIVAALALAGTAGFQRVRENARCVTEISAARNLIAAYLGHAADNGGQVLAGYQTDPAATNLDGEELHFPLNARYPWRLAPNVPKIEGVMLYNGHEKALGAPDRDYLVSVRPNMGLSATLVGGHFGSGSPLVPSQRMIDAVGRFYLSHLNDSASPEKLVVFASARSSDGGGYYEVRPPNLLSRVWSSMRFSEKSAPSDHGFVDFRWGGKAAVACLAGNVELLDEESLRDMRRWSVQADRSNDRDFMIRPQ